MRRSASHRADLCHPLIRNTFKYASKRYRGKIAADLKPIFRAPTREAGVGDVRGVRGEVGHALSRDRAAVAQRLGYSSCRSWTTTPRFGRAVLEEHHRVMNARYRRAITCARALPRPCRLR